MYERGGGWRGERELDGGWGCGEMWGGGEETERERQTGTESETETDREKRMERGASL